VQIAGTFKLVTNLDIALSTLSNRLFFYDLLIIVFF